MFLAADFVAGNEKPCRAERLVAVEAREALAMECHRLHLLYTHDATETHS